jgi:hypothetical protein
MWEQVSEHMQEYFSTLTLEKIISQAPSKKAASA